MTTSNAPDARVQVASPKYYVKQLIAKRVVTTRFVGPEARKCALLYYEAVPALGVEVNYGKGPAKIR
jgi:hypothetical protein